jgi:ATP-dependent DNA helicase RecG
MRPDLLNPLFSPVTRLAGIGPKVAKTLGKLVSHSEADEIPRVIDLLFHLPVGIIDRTRQPGIAGAIEGEIVTLKVTVDRHAKSPRGNRRIPYRVLCHDETGDIALTFFHANGDWLERTLPVGEQRYVSGRLEWFNGQATMVHPDHVLDEANFASMPLIEPVYPMTAGLARKTMIKAVSEALDLIPDLPEWLDGDLVSSRGWPSAGEALFRLHRPESGADLEPNSLWRSRLAHDELLASQIAIALMRDHQRRSRGRARIAEGKLKAALLAALPFELTGGQLGALAEIEADLARPERMLRLLQGDVGSGKTVVALLAAATVIETGGQAALMAPTELLARQHARTLAPLAEAAGLRVAVLTGRERGRERDAILADLANGSIHILTGTHALFQAGVEFADLSLVVVDEQHRFGVHQRLALTTKGEAPDVLVMTATPIPRTLVLTYYGDMDVSHLTEKPAGRQPIDTRVMPLQRLDQVIGRIRTAISDGAKVYWICPLVEESDELDIASAEQRHAELTAALGDGVGLVHGRMKQDERDVVMTRFRDGDVNLLVATTVVEVGVDVVDATIIVIEHAERFGLSQLHQLRGRVGRGEAKSTCLLLYKSPLGEIARERLSIIRQTEDGFRIAEEDLRLRGSGEILGTRQSGLPGFRIAMPEIHGELMELARKQARHLVDDDPSLSGARGEAWRVLLYLFSREEAVRLLRAG